MKSILILSSLLVMFVISPAFAENYEVDIVSGAYQKECQLGNKCLEPHTITIIVEDSITWINKDIFSHQIVTIQSEDDERVAGNFDTGHIPPGEKGSFTFRLNGIYQYHDPEYPHIIGTVIVKTGHTQPDFDWTLESILFSNIEGKNTAPTTKQPLYITNKVANIGEGNPPETNFGLSIYKGPELAFQGFEKLSVGPKQSDYATYTWTPKEPGKYTFIFTSDSSDYTLETIMQNNIDYREFFIYDGIAPPAIQERYGVSFDMITCEKGLELAKKKTTGSPICASSTTISKLLERGFLTN
ncbi:CARDB domain-containing protein [Nitrosopumilus sp. b2]|uniref:CARDB domain-containing protein n=1 Tax=Nitrosopumilus sp. b2 TaxID=2109908 RepID=UPI0015F63B76|nr:CARDB domain-containing protein [Nitrosopumilus sp. b2]KAF6244249.1 hypothetical protein C6989_08100 [Nitrosopumilus sp. b2]